jgi:endonuclease/exonuclease/phosphatase family metal-dependent hydrolase
MGTLGSTRLIAICLVTVVAMPQGIVSRLASAEPMVRDTSVGRMVRIDMAAQAPLPRLVPISLAPPPPASAAPRALAGPASPPLVPISYAPVPAESPAPATLTPLPIPATPKPVYAAAPAPVAIPAPVAAPVYAPAPVASYTPPPALAYAPISLPPPLPVYVPPSAPAPPPLPVPAMPVSLAPPLPAPLPQQAMLPQQTPLPPPLPAPLPAPLPQQAMLPAPTVPPQRLPPPTPALPPPAVVSAPAAVPSPPPLPPQPAPAGGKSTDAIKIATFNIQVFGESKIAKPQVVDVLARVVRNFDIVAVQEVRAKSDSVIPQFLSAINADGSRYQFVIGPRLGRTVSKEQYTFIYDSTRIEIDPSSVGTSPNPGDRLHRPPLHARFRVRANPPESGFSFWLVDTHTDPDEVALEVNALAEVFQEMKALRPDEDDVILLGDLNAGPPQFGKIKQIPGIGWAVSGVTTNTRRSKTYDNLIFDTRTTTEYTGTWGVLDLQNTFGLSLDKALEVSDHNPVWAAFRPWETRLTAGVPGSSGLTQ